MKPSLLSLLLLASCARSTLGPESLQYIAPENVGMSAATLDRIPGDLEEMVEDGRIPGSVALVARNGKIVHLSAVGQARAGSDEPMATDAIFRIYSMTKPITSVAIMSLWEDGLFGLDDPVSRYIPELGDMRVWQEDGDTAPARREMTVRDLLRHTSGLSYGYFSANKEVDRLYTAQGLLDQDSTTTEMCRKLGDLPLLFSPGEAWEYSVADDVLARLGEVLTGQTFDVVLEERVFGPLGMRDTGYFVPEDQAHRLVSNHDGRCRPFDDPEGALGRVPSMRCGGQGLVSTAEDYLRFAQMMLEGGALDGARVLEPETVAMMTRDQLPEGIETIQFGGFPMPGTGFGLGVSVRTSRSFGSRQSVGTYGWGGAASTTFFVSPEDGLIGICMCQQMPMNMAPGGLLERLAFKALED